MCLSLVLSLKLGLCVFPKLWNVHSHAELGLHVTVTDYQCILVLVCCAVQGTISIWQYRDGFQRCSPWISGVVLLVPRLATFWSTTLTIATWDTLIHRVVSRGSKSPIAGVAQLFAKLSAFLLILVVSCWSAILAWRENASAAADWAKAAQTIVAVPACAVALLSLAYCLVLGRTIRRMSIRAPEDSGCLEAKQLDACHTTCSCCIALALLFLTQATTDLAAGWVGQGSAPASLFEGGLPLATVHALTSTALSVVIVFVVVKYDEVTAACDLALAPFAAVADYILRHLAPRYSKVPAPDFEDAPGPKSHRTLT
jgi:hypothetical protein